ncbi:cyclic GMP-AMP synthase-like receptor isoform X2 [Mytilus edulis]|uniref:cyclic GMP-AMP synthase-like receptor isoform X2 n=1 Tax=Mytilus edulis TaxID=6550 RepID=UPI0039EEF636
MSKLDEKKSLEFYAYLCQKIGSKNLVKARRVLYTIGDIAMDNNFPRISSGSKGEGLNFKSSDTDVMFLEPNLMVYEYGSDLTDNHKEALIMDTRDTPPCFTYLRISTSLYSDTEQMLQQKDGESLLSNELLKMHRLNNLASSHTFRNLHGPCISDDLEQYDIAYCIKCEKWISQAQPWVNRSRTLWPSSNLVSQITSLGVLFVPIGCKGSVNEHVEWRISFSVAEKMLIFSFSHTQLLCYALLKILLKEVIEKDLDLKGILCSYFLKTLMFWMSEESDQSIWRPDNIIQCFMACLHDRGK